MWMSVAGAGIQLLWSALWDGCWPQKKSSPGAQTSKTSCSLLVCCHNEAHHLDDLISSVGPCLDELETQGWTVQALVIDHGSTDDTLQVLEKATASDKRWLTTSIQRTRATKKEALEAGMQLATGRVIVLIDADCRPCALEWLVQMTGGALNQWDVHVGLSLPVQENDAKMSWLQRLQRLEARRLAQRAAGAVQMGAPYLGFGRNLAFTRDIWDAVKGMQSHAHLPSGDDDLWLQEAAAKGARVHVALDQSAQTESHWPLTWMAWRRQKTRHFTASTMYPWHLRLRLLLPGIGWLLLLGALVHNPSGTSVAIFALAVMVRTLTFGKFLHRIGQPASEAIELVFEPVVSVFRLWSWCKGQTADSTPWK